MKKIACIVLGLGFLASQPVAAGAIENEVIILLDASGSTYDSGYVTWLAMLDMAEQIVSQTEADNTAHGIGIFSGNSSSHTVYSTALAGRMNMLWGLSDGAIDPYTGDAISGSQNPGDVAGLVAGLDESDWKGGYSWYDDALEMAYQSFAGSSNPSDTDKYIFMIGDGGSPTSGHESYFPGGYYSPTFQNLQALDVTFSSIYFETGGIVDSTYFENLVSDPAYFVNATAFGSSFDASTIVTNNTPSVPEPESTLLFGMGLFGLLLRRRQRISK